MHDKYPWVDTVWEWQPVVDFCEKLDHGGGVLGLHLPLKPVHLVHVLRLVVAPRHEEVVGEQQLEPEQGEDALHAERATVNKITWKEKCPYLPFLKSFKKK